MAIRITIIGSGMGEAKLSRINVDLTLFDAVVCDKSYKIDIEHPNIVQLGFVETKKYLLEHGKSQNIAYIVSGSPFFYSGATIITNELKNAGIEFKIIPAISSKEYLIQRLAIAEQDVSVVSLHGRELDLLEFMIKRYTFLLCDDESPKRVKEALLFVKDFRVTIGSRLGFDDEFIGEVDLDEIGAEHAPFVLLIEKLYVDKSSITPDDELVIERGMFTKPYKRHLILQTLELSPNMTLWDVGAGSGSVSIDAFKSYRVKTVLFEKNSARCEMIRENLKNHSVICSKLYEGDACEMMGSELSTPDRIFFGGGGEGAILRFGEFLERLKDGGFLVATFVSLEHLSLAFEVLKKLEASFEVKSISLTTYKEPLSISEPERLMFLVKAWKK